MITQREINQICYKEDLIFKKIIRTSNRFVLVLCKEGIVLKILRDPKRNFARISLKKETAALEFFNALKNPLLKVPKLLGKNLSGKYPYYEEEFIRGGILEREAGYFFRELKRRQIKKLLGILFILNKVEPTQIKRKIPDLSDFGAAYFDSTLKLHHKEMNKFLTGVWREKISRLVKKAKNLSASDKVVVHGEIYPNNLMENEKGDIFLIDWENIGIGSPARDSASVYMRIKEKPLSEFFLSNLKLLKQKDFRVFFSLEVALQSIGGLAYIKWNRKKTAGKEWADAKTYFLDKIKTFL